MPKFKLAVAFLILLLFSACIKEPSIEDRLLCLDLSSYSKADIPKCDSQEKCFESAQKEFGQKQKLLPPLIENNLTDLTNHVAQSWLYFNRAIGSLNSIHGLCLESSGFTGIDTKANELNHNLVRAFEESDSAHSLAFAILQLEKTHLENEDIELIKEEKLFETFVAANDNLNELAAGRALGQSSFASNYFLNALHFEEISKQAGFGKNIIRETTVFDLVNGVDEKILSHVPKNPFYLPIIASSLGGLIDYAANAFSLNQSVSSMKNFPPFDMLLVFNRFVGTNNSSIKEFFALNNSIEANLDDIHSRNAGLRAGIQKELDAAEEKISQIDSAAYSDFDENFLQGLARSLGGKEEIGSSGFETTQLESAKTEFSLRLFSLKQEFNSLVSEEFLFGVSLGKDVSGLKNLLSRTKSLNENIDFVAKDEFEGIMDSCAKRVSVIGEKVSKTDYSQFNEAVWVLSDEIRSKAEEFEKTTVPKERLLLCRPVVEKFLELNAAIENFDTFELSRHAEFEACFSEMEAVFGAKADYFIDLFPLFSKISAQKGSGNNSALLEACKNLRQKVALSFGGLLETQEITQNHLAAKRLFGQLSVLKNAFPGSVSSSAFFNLRQKIETQQSFFELDKLSAEKSVSNLSALRENSAKLLDETNAFFSKSFAQYLESGAQISSPADELVKADSFSKNEVKIAIANGLQSFDGKILLKIPLEQFDNAELSSASQNVLRVSFEKGVLSAELSGVPSGLTGIVLSSTAVLAKTTQSTETVFLTQATALMESEITVLAKAEIANLEVSAPLPEFEKIRPGSVNVLFRQQSLPFSLEGKKISFKAQNVFGNDKFSVFFEINQPLSVAFESLETTRLDQNSFEYVFAVNVSNLTNINFKIAKIGLPFPFGEKNFSKIEIFDEAGREVSAENTFDGMFSLFVPEIFPKEKLRFLAKLEAQNYSEYWQSAIAEIEALAEKLSLSESASDRQKGEGFLQELSKIKETADFENSKKIFELLTLSERINEAATESKSSETGRAKFFELQREVEEEIDGAKLKAAKLAGLGFEAQAKEIEDSIQKAALINSKAGQMLAGDADSAFLALLNAKNALSNLAPKSFIESLKKKNDALMQKAQALFELKIDDSLKKEITAIEKETERLIGSPDFLQAAKNVLLLESKVNGLESAARKNSAGVFAQKTAQAKEFLGLVESFPKKIDSLKKMLGSKEALDELQYLFPTTKDRLDKMELKFNSLADTSLIEKLGSVDLSDENGFAVSVNALNELGSEFDKGFLELKKIDAEVSGDLAKVEKDAKTVLAFAKLKSKDRLVSQQAQEELFLAEQKIESSDFVGSMSHSKKAVSFMGSAALPEINIPVAVYPLALIAIAALYFKHKKRNAPAPQKVKIERAGDN